MTGFDDMIRWQREMIAVNTRQLSAMASAVTAGRDMLSAQKAMTDMAEANMAAWRGWLGLWGVKWP